MHQTGWNEGVNMAIIKLHMEICILCITGSIILKILFKEQLLRYTKGRQKKKRNARLIFFCPVLNILSFLLLIFMAICDDGTAKEIRDIADKNS